MTGWRGANATLQALTRQDGIEYTVFTYSIYLLNPLHAVPKPMCLRLLHETLAPTRLRRTALPVRLQLSARRIAAR
jgi:hypothetical protein